MNNSFHLIIYTIFDHPQMPGAQDGVHTVFNNIYWQANSIVLYNSLFDSSNGGKTKVVRLLLLNLSPSCYDQHEEIGSFQLHR